MLLLLSNNMGCTNYGNLELWRNNMANSTLASIRARLAAAEQKNTTNYDKATFPFWNAKTDTTSTVRFVPDGDTKNDFFWVEKQQIKLPFNGIKGGENKPVTVNVPCVEMFGKDLFPKGCPILSEVRSWYKTAEKTGDSDLKDKANKYWKKPVYIMQGFVRENAVLEDQAPENPIRRFSFNKQLYNLVKAGLMDPEMENLPCDYDKGSDFRITKSSKGSYADYGTSSYARRESPLHQVELDAIEQYGLSNLSQFLGNVPTEEDINILFEMFEASVDGEAYDPEKWEKYFRPTGYKNAENAEEKTVGQKTETVNTSSETKTSVPDQKESKETPEKEDAQATESATTKTSAADILKMIKSRKEAKA